MYTNLIYASKVKDCKNYLAIYSLLKTIEKAKYFAVLYEGV